ncbi:hypothetical protein SAMN06272741_5686 [Streptomyces sp. 2114.4]|nr:hypothetical protein SAMN06272741_5686 [Streptomyces sp. 2114.4]
MTLLPPAVKAIADLMEGMGLPEAGVINRAGQIYAFLEAQKPTEPTWRSECPMERQSGYTSSRSLANLTKHSLDQVTKLVKTRLKRMQYRPCLIDGLVAKTGLDRQCSVQPSSDRRHDGASDATRVDEPLM